MCVCVFTRCSHTNDDDDDDNWPLDDDDAHARTYARAHVKLPLAKSIAIARACELMR